MAADTSDSRLARPLGWLSVVLGLSSLVAPTAMARGIGLRPTEGTGTLLRAVGAQELLVSWGLLRRRRPAGWQWTRVIGDLTHVAMLNNALASRDSDARRIRRVMAAVAAIAGVDVLAGVRLTRLARSRRRREPVEARRTITVRRPASEVYRHWRDFGNLPTFMVHLRSVESIDGGARSHWVAEAPAGTTVEWDAQLVEDVPGELIAWRSQEGARVSNHGRVRFAPAPGDQGTEVHVEIRYDPPAGRVGAVVAKLLGQEPDQQLADDLRRFKQVLETGEVVRSDGSPDGPDTRRLLQQHPARPAVEGSKKP